MLISIVVPVHGVRPYLTACLDSVLASADVEVEVIAVDDASPDGSGQLLEERAGLDHRLSIIHLDRSEGPGNARNVGLAKATGDYVWFVDGDDLVSNGAMPLVRARLEQSYPDVLLIDYSERWPDGSDRPSHGVRLLRTAPTGNFTLADAPEVINLTMTAWSKLFRRKFLVGLNEPFRAGIHEDIPVTCAALLAGRLAVLDQVCYAYRRARPGSFMVTTTSKHWAVFDAYEEVLTMLGALVAAGAKVATPAVCSAVFERAIGHYAAVLQARTTRIDPGGERGLVPDRERRRFFARMHADFARYRPQGYRLPRGPLGAKFWLIEHNAYGLYELLEPLNIIRVAMSGRLARDRST